MKPKRDEHQFQLTAQQVKALNLPTFESFPYLTTRVIPARTIWRSCLDPSSRSCCVT